MRSSSTGTIENEFSERITTSSVMIFLESYLRASIGQLIFETSFGNKLHMRMLQLLLDFLKSPKLTTMTEA